jgi:hypothetical protein
MKAWPGEEATAAAGAVRERSAQAATGDMARKRPMMVAFMRPEQGWKR